MSAYTADANRNAAFYLNVLGFRLVKKTVNQDAPSMYHLFYGDKHGTPGTELTFFEIPFAGRTYKGTNCISRTGLFVANDDVLTYWINRFKENGVNYGKTIVFDGRKQIAFEDFEGQQYLLVVDENRQQEVVGTTPWGKGPVKKEHAIIGLGPVELTVFSAKETANVLTHLFGFYKKTTIEDLTVYTSNKFGAGAEFRIKEDKDSSNERPGRGSVHHIALRVESRQELEKWALFLTKQKQQHSGVVDRHYFQSIYMTDPNGIVYELATDGPGLEIDEESEKLGERLSLPPFLEQQRDEIETKLKPIILGG